MISEHGFGSQCQPRAASSPHTVTVGSFAANQNDAIDDTALESLYAHLTEHGVVLSIRRGMLRFALHLYNNEADVDRVLDLTRSWLAGR